MHIKSLISGENISSYLQAINREVTPINCNFFLLGNDILYYLKFPLKSKNENSNNDNYNPGTLPYLRIIDESNPINYHNIIQTKIINPSFRTSRSNTIKYFPSLNNELILDKNLNKENYNIMGNFSLLNNTKNTENRITTSLFTNHTDNNILSEIQNENNIIKNPYTIMPTNTFQSNIFRTELKRRNSLQMNEYFYRYDITSFVDNYNNEQLFSLAKIGFDHKVEDNRHYLYINTDENNNFNFSQVIYFSKKDVTVTSLNNSSLYNSLKNDSFSSQIIEQLYVNFLDGFDESNKGKNCEKKLKNYDISFNMDYFAFVEKCKEFVL